MYHVSTGRLQGHGLQKSTWYMVHHGGRLLSPSSHLKEDHRHGVACSSARTSALQRAQPASTTAAAGITASRALTNGPRSANRLSLHPAICLTRPIKDYTNKATPAAKSIAADTGSSLLLGPTCTHGVDGVLPGAPPRPPNRAGSIPRQCYWATGSDCCCCTRSVSMQVVV
jgi:hypothetical protein